MQGHPKAHRPWTKPLGQRRISPKRSETRRRHSKQSPASHRPVPEPPNRSGPRQNLKRDGIPKYPSHRRNGRQLLRQLQRNRGRLSHQLRYQSLSDSRSYLRRRLRSRNSGRAVSVVDCKRQLRRISRVQRSYNRQQPHQLRSTGRAQRIRACRPRKDHSRTISCLTPKGVDKCRPCSRSHCI